RLPPPAAPPISSPPPPSTLFPYTTLFRSRVMAEVRRRARSPMRRIWRGLVEPRDIELRLRLRPWVVWGTALAAAAAVALLLTRPDRKSTRLNSSHVSISYAVFCLKKE